MKRTKFFAFLLCCMSAFLFASCLNDDTPDTGLTDAQRQQCLNSIKGDYDGDLIFLSQNPTVTTDKTDTLDIAWKVSAIDTTLTVYSFPASLIAKELKDGETKTALMQASGASLKAKMGFYQNTPVIGFMIFPMPVVYNVIYGGKKHKVSAYFKSNGYSFGLHSATQKLMQMQYVLGGVYLDDDLNTNLIKKDVPFFLSSKW